MLDLRDSFASDLAQIAERYQVSEGADVEDRKCPALLDDECECVGGHHSLTNLVGLVSRQCGLIRYRAELQARAELLSACLNGAAVSDPVGDQLRKAIDEDRPVAKLGAMLALLDAVRQRGFRGQAGHIGLTGSIGTAKTHALLCLHFSALWQGVNSRWVTTGQLADLALRKESYDRADRTAYVSELVQLQRAAILCLDDLGDRISDPRAKEPGSTTQAGVLLDLLNGFSGRIFLTSNLPSQGRKDEPQDQGHAQTMASHPDLGPRVVSRLRADHKGVSALGIGLLGRDQRRFVARTYLDASAQDG